MIQNTLGSLYQVLKKLFLFSCSQEESIEITKISDFRVLMDLHVLERPERDLTFFRKCLPVYETHI